MDPALKAAKLYQTKRVLVGTYIIMENYYIRKRRIDKVGVIQNKMIEFVNITDIAVMNKYVKSIDIDEIRDVFNAIKMDYDVNVEYILSTLETLTNK